MNCRFFQAKHADFLDHTLSECDRAAVDSHLRVCASCAAEDVRVRRALMLARNTPTPRVSERFSRELERKLRDAATTPRDWSVTTPPETGRRLGLAAAVTLLVLGISDVRTSDIPLAEMPPVEPPASEWLEPAPVFSSNTPLTLSAAGVPIWSAMLIAQEAPARFVNARFGE